MAVLGEGSFPHRCAGPQCAVCRWERLVPAVREVESRREPDADPHSASRLMTLLWKGAAGEPNRFPPAGN